MQEESISLLVLFLLLGITIGVLIGWLLARLWLNKAYLAKNELKEHFVGKALFDNLQEKADVLQAEVNEKNDEIKSLTANNAGSQQKILHLEQQLEQQKWEAIEWHEQSKAEFEVLANRLLEEKSQKFTEQNWKKLSELLLPLGDKIKSFEDQVEKRFLEETKDRISLKKELEHLQLLNTQLSQDANNLAKALRGKSKVQGDWGELQLQLLLEKSGLSAELHYKVQANLQDINGKNKRPDFIIYLPNDRHLVIDSKVSLSAYERFYNAENKAKQQEYLKAHLDSIKKHVKELSNKKYHHLYQINAPDYVLMFVPIEPALTIAQQEDQNILLDALDQNIVIVTNSTLLATMRTVSHIWRQEKQKNNVQEIARQSGLLYDKFCAFVEDLKDVGHKIDHANQAYHRAMNKLVDGKRKGDTLIERAEKIKQLGAKASKQLPRELLGR